MPEVSLPTQKFVEVADIKNGVVFLKKGGLRKIFIVGGINFDLKSEAEQNLILQSFQNFLNTLDAGIQFFIHSRKINVSEYLERLRARRDEEPNELLKIQIEDYAEFIRVFVEENPIISKNFFVVVPYDPVGIAAQAKGIFSLFKKTPAQKEEMAKEEQERKNVEELNRRADQVMNGLEQMGLRATALDDEELVELFYNLYNPELVEKKGLEIAKQ